MKTLLLVLGLLGAAGSTQAQVFIQGKAIPDSCRHLHIQMVRRDGRLQVRPRIGTTTVDRQSRLTTASGTVLEFDSVENLFDYLDQAGWEYLDSYTSVAGGNGGTYAYLFRRRRPGTAR